MSYSGLLQLLDSDLEPDKILAMLAKSVPSIGKKISKLVMGGASTGDILSYLVQDKEARAIPASKIRSSDPIDLSRSIARQAKSSGPESQSEIDKRQLMDLSQNLLSTSGALGGGYLLGKGLQNAPKIAQKIGGAITGRKPSVTPQQVATQPVAEAFGQAPQVTEAAAGVLSPVPNSPEVNQLIDKLGLGSKIKRVAERTAPEAITGALRNMITPDMERVIQEKSGKSIGEAVKNYAENYLSDKEKGSLSLESLRKQAQNLNAPQEVSNVPKDQKVSQRLVALPNGEVGTLLEEKQGIGTIQTPDGKTKRQKLSDLEMESPEFEQKITDLIEAIPEDERSAVLAFASYNPGQEFSFEGKKHNIPMMGVQFHNGDFYMYPGVSKEQFDKVVSKATKAKTSGGNPWHAWTAGKESRGAGMAELIKELEANFGKNFIKFKANEGYDFWQRVRKKVSEIVRNQRKKSS